MRPPPIWLALHVPFLSLEAHVPCHSPSAVVERGRVLLADGPARQAGVACGMGVAAARSLVPQIRLLPRNLDREAAALHTLACWAGCFTPRISLSCDTLLLEVGSCLRLFGGLRRLVACVTERAQSLQFALVLAAAPTPRAAEWLAQLGAPVFCGDPSALAQYLDRLPVQVLPPRAAERLHRFGMQTLGQLRRLPSAQLARRIGADSVRQLAQAYGEEADVRADFEFPERFSLSLSLPAVVENAAALVFAARRLVSALAGWLAVRQAGVCALILHLRHEREVTPVHLRFVEATADESRFARVLREKLERMNLSAPVESLCLEADEVLPISGANGQLFNAVGVEREGVGVLLERLVARFGEAQVYRLSPRADHRPECATRRLGIHETQPIGAVQPLPRPLWLLDRPESLREVDGRPHRQGALELLAGPERIESGWWAKDEADDPGDIRRDYFVARTQDGHWLWIYRECREPGGWFVHGFFA